MIFASRVVVAESEMANANVPVLQSVRAAVDFLRFSAPQTAGVLGAVMLANVISAAAGDPVVRVATGVIGVLIGVMANAALLRLAFADEHGGDSEFRIGLMGFQWGRPELRLLGGMLLLLLLFVLALLMLILVSTVCGVAAAVGSGVAVQPNTLPPGTQAIVGVCAFIFALMCIWVGVRVSLYPAATIAEKRLMVFSTWKLTKGQFWRVFAAIVIVLLPTLVLTLILAGVKLAPAVALPLSLLLAVVNAFVEVPLICGLYAYLYRGLRPAGLAGTAASV